MSPSTRPTFSRPLRITQGMPATLRSAPTPTHTMNVPPLTTSFDSYRPHSLASFISPIPLPLGQLPSLNGRPLVHAALAYRPGTALPISYDAAFDPSTAVPYGINEPTMHHYLGQDALSVATECLVLECPALCSTITVRAGAAVDARSPYVHGIVPLPPTSPSMGAQTDRHFAPITVSNVFNAIHIKLHESLPVDSFATLDARVQRAVLSVAQVRYTLHPEEYEKGLKRIDLLTAAGMGTRVAGLSATEGSLHVWVLNFG